MTGHKKLPWDEYAQDDFEPDVARAGTATLRVRYGREVVTYDGKCPFCLGLSVSTYSRSVRPTERGAIGLDLRSVTVPMRCECPVVHSAAPAGERGCGRTWDIIVTPTGKQEATITEARPADPAEVSQNIRKREMHRQELQSVRAMAQNWRNGVGLSGIAGGAVGLIAIPAVIAAASRASIVDGAHLLLFGAVITAIALWLALRASFGWPTRLVVDEPHSLARWEADEAERSVRYLWASIITTMLAAVVLGAAGAVLVFEVPLFFHFADWE